MTQFYKLITSWQPPWRGRHSTLGYYSRPFEKFPFMFYLLHSDLLRRRAFIFIPFHLDKMQTSSLGSYCFESLIPDFDATLINQRHA